MMYDRGSGNRFGNSDIMQQSVRANENETNSTLSFRILRNDSGDLFQVCDRPFSF